MLAARYLALNPPSATSCVNNLARVADFASGKTVDEH
jgi:hypothetical protein